jgi:hypothetical protein
MYRRSAPDLVSLYSSLCDSQDEDSLLPAASIQPSTRHFISESLNEGHLLESVVPTSFTSVTFVTSDFDKEKIA